VPLRPNRSGCEKGFGYSHPHWEAGKGRASGHAARGGALAPESPRDTRITHEFIRNLSKNILFFFPTSAYTEFTQLNSKRVKLDRLISTFGNTRKWSQNNLSLTIELEIDRDDRDARPLPEGPDANRTSKSMRLNWQIIV